ncbi:MAG TPA: hypothetical protein PLK76_03835 [bacterium]|nr:hypothetical protein [bacterium]
MSKQIQDLTPEQLLWKIYENTEKTRKYILWGRVMSLIYLILIVAPIILAIIYLPPMLSNVIQPYKEFLGDDPKTTKLLEQINKLQNSGLDLNQLLK